MKLRNQLSYIALGGLLMFIGMLASSVFMPSLFAQRDKFGDIECTRLAVVDADGKLMALVGRNEHGGEVAVLDKDGKLQALLDTTERGGRTSVYVKGGKAAASLFANEHGGHVAAYGRGKGMAAMSVNQYGNGSVSTWDNNGNRQ